MMSERAPMPERIILAGGLDQGSVGPTHALAERFVELVRSLPQVRRVLLESSRTGTRLWTVIEAEPFDDSQRDPVYEAELRVLQGDEPVGVDFRLVNLAEFPPDGRATILPATAATLYQR